MLDRWLPWRPFKISEIALARRWAALTACRGLFESSHCGNLCGYLGQASPLASIDRMVGFALTDCDAKADSEVFCKGIYPHIYFLLQGAQPRLHDQENLMSKTAALFMNGGSQAVRLPADCRFEGQRVFVRRDPRTGDVILSSKSASTWDEFMRLREEIGPLSEAQDFMLERPMNASGGLGDPFTQPLP